MSAGLAGGGTVIVFGEGISPSSHLEWTMTCDYVVIGGGSAGSVASYIVFCCSRTIEIKSSATVTGDLFKGLRKWLAIAGDAAQLPRLMCAVPTSYQR